MPALASAFEANNPAGPAPITSTSTLVSLIKFVGMVGEGEDGKRKLMYSLLLPGSPFYVKRRWGHTLAGARESNVTARDLGGSEIGGTI